MCHILIHVALFILLSKINCHTSAGPSRGMKLGLGPEEVSVK